MPDKRREQLRDLLGKDTLAKEQQPAVQVHRGTRPHQEGFDHPLDAAFINCPECNSRVAVHCTTCKTHITNCSCDFAGKVTAEVEAQRKRRLGLWTPGG